MRRKAEREKRFSIAVELRRRAADRMAQDQSDSWSEVEIALTWLAIAEDRLAEYLQNRKNTRNPADFERYRLARVRRLKQ
jgi:hypothetical protein